MKTSFFNPEDLHTLGNERDPKTRFFGRALLTRLLKHPACSIDLGAPRINFFHVKSNPGTALEAQQRSIEYANRVGQTTRGFVKLPLQVHIVFIYFSQSHAPSKSHLRIGGYEGAQPEVLRSSTGSSLTRCDQI